MSSPLETAADPANLRRIAIDPVTRVEGHGKVTILLDAEHRVHQVRLHIVEFRGFERFVQGRPYWELPVLVQRLCGICPVSHHLAASKALDHVVGAPRVPQSAELNRRLMHYGQILQSHALHFYHLASPDLLFGFDAEPARRNLVGVLAAHPDVARQGILLRRYGQEVIRHTAGKRIHGTGSVPGGVNHLLTAAGRDELRAGLPDVLGWARAGVALVEGLYAANRALHDSFGTVPSPLMSLVAPDGTLDLYDGALRVRDAAGGLVVDQVPPEGYRELLREDVKSWSYLKFPWLAALGPELGWYKVGPLARLQCCDRMGTPLADEARDAFVAGGVQHAPLAFHRARMIELLHAAEVIGRLLDDDDLLSGELTASGPRAGSGVGILEAPRGTLIHDYDVGPDDLVTRCNLIVSTTHNNTAMNEAIRQVARQHLDGREPTQALLNHVEVAIRAYDPCLSCATHALGQMPLAIDVLDAEGARVAHLARGSEPAGP
jgi:NAD-reducing hydrogenase large subunit